jgi:hypothetical protein
MNKKSLILLLVVGQFVFSHTFNLRAATDNELKACNTVTRFLLLSCKADLQDILDKPVYEDPAGIKELTGSTFGAFGRHPVKAISIDNPGYENTIENPNRDYNGYYFVHDEFIRLKVTLFYPSDMCTPRPTVFFMAGWENYQYQEFYSLLYFIASHGYNAVFVPSQRWKVTSSDHIKDILESVVTNPLFKNKLDLTRVGFMAHSIAGGLMFHLEQQLRQWGKNGRFIYTLAGWASYNQQVIPYAMADNTRIIIQTFNEELNNRPHNSDTDPRFSIDFLTSTTTKYSEKTYLYLPGDAQHASSHSTPKSRYDVHGQKKFYYNALQQVGLFRPLQSLLGYSFGFDISHKEIGLPAANSAMQIVNGISFYSGDKPYLDLGIKDQDIYSSGRYAYPFDKGVYDTIYSDVTIATKKTTYAPNEDITIFLEKMHENNHDWIGIFPAEVPLIWDNLYNDAESSWQWVHFTKGSVTFTNNSDNNADNNLPPGDYVAAAYFANQSGAADVKATIAFTIAP